jgi:hypothetical protein
MQTLIITSTPRRTSPPPARVPRPLARVRRAAAEIAPETIERIAQRVVQLLHHERQQLDDGADASRDLMDAGELARHLGLTRAWVYEHAQQLGAIPVGNGPRPRLRFDTQTAMKALNARQRRDETVATKTDGPRPGRPRRHPASSTVPLLPVHEPRTRGILARWQRRTHRRRG